MSAPTTLPASTALLPALRAIGLLTRTGAHHLAGVHKLPVVVPAEARPRTPATQLYYIAYPNSTETVETGEDAVADAMRFYGHPQYLLQDRDTFALEPRRICPTCGLGYPAAEFKNPPFYCHQSEGMEGAEDSEECRECLRDTNTKEVMP